MRPSIILLALLTFSSASLAGDNISSTERMAKCGYGNQSQQNSCIAGAFKELDARLNHLYNELINSLENPQPLREAQAGWIKFRDLTCKYETSGIAEGGSILPFAQNACLAEQTSNRIKDIERYKKEECNGCPTRKFQPQSSGQKKEIPSPIL